MPTYEYVVVARETRYVPSPGQPGTWLADYYIWWPDAVEAEPRLDKDSGEWVKIAGDLGRQGWRLTIAEIPRSSVFQGGTENGWQGMVSFPLSERWYFERLVSP